MTTRLTAYVPCFNNAATVRGAVESLLSQTIRPVELLVVDDGSRDGLTEALRNLPVRLLRSPDNQGRGSARAWAMSEAKGNWVVCCDATNVLPVDFVEQALRRCDKDDVAAVCGRITQPPGKGVVHRWRGRHLFKAYQPGQLSEDASLATYGAIMRKSAVLEVGNYDSALRHSEDAELGERLRAAGWKVIQDPSLLVISVSRNSLAQVLERYWRWHAGHQENVRVIGYLRNALYSLKCMARQDLADRDPLGAAISLAAPHYCFWRSVFRRCR